MLPMERGPGRDRAGSPGRTAAALAWIDKHDRFVLVLPAVVFVALVLVFPLVYTVRLSFQQWFLSSVRPATFIGLDNYRQMLTDERLWEAVIRTFSFVGLAVGCQVVVGVLAALLFHQPFAGRGLARTLFLLPMFATPAAAAMVWMMLFDPVLGPISYFQRLIGIEITWLADPRWVIPALAVVDTWHWAPLVMLLVLAGLASLPTEPFEAARVDGATGLQIFWSITLPLLRPTIVVAAMFRVIDALKVFDTIVVMTGGGPGRASETINIYAFNQLFTGFHFGYGSALLVLLAVLVYGTTLILSRVRRTAWHT